MAETKIEWADYTFNAWIGCTKVSPACNNCYAWADFDVRKGRAAWGPNGTRSVTADSNWKNPVKWNRWAEIDRKVWEFVKENPHVSTWEVSTDITSGRLSALSLDRLAARGLVLPLTKGPRTVWIAKGSEWIRPRVFVNSLSDWAEDWRGDMVDHKGRTMHIDPNTGKWYADDQMKIGKSLVTMTDVRQRLFALIDATPNLDWLLLTKRPENILDMWPPFGDATDGMMMEIMGANQFYRRNVWIGTTVENQEQARKRLPELEKCRHLSPVLFVSAEPLLGEVDLRPWLNWISWVIAGGESGPGARPSHPEWFRSLRGQCEAAGVPFFFKQFGEWLPVPIEKDNEFSGGHAFECPVDGRTAAVIRERSKKAFQSGKWRRMRAGDQTKKYYVLDERTVAVKVGKKKAGRLLDGVQHDGVPSCM